jgi:hypothetical protein
MAEQFRNFSASELYCPKCGKAQPVREKLLLILPSGELYEYLCSTCASSLGKRTVTSPAFSETFAAPPPVAAASRRAGGRRLPRLLR